MPNVSISEYGDMRGLSVCCLLVSSNTLLLPAQTANCCDNSAMREVVKKYLNAREHGDPEAVAELFT
jgi:hypothetical protein